MTGLLAYAAGTSISNAIDLDRVPNLINASGIPAAKFGVVLQSERAAAVVYLFAPTPASLAAYQAAISATDKATPPFVATMRSHAVLGSESPAGAREIETILGGLKQLPTLRKAIQARAITPLQALGFYSQGPADTIKLFLIQTKSVDPPTNQLPPAVGLIATVQAREELSQESALVAGMLAGRRMTTADRAAFAGMVTGQAGPAAVCRQPPGPALAGRLERRPGRIRGPAEEPGQHRAGDHRGYPDRQAPGDPGAVAGDRRPADAGQLQRRRGGRAGDHQGRPHRSPTMPGSGSPSSAAPGCSGCS